jgi:hypothetical protein
MFADVDLLVIGMCIILVEEPIPNNNTKGNWHVNAKYLVSSTRIFVFLE